MKYCTNCGQKLPDNAKFCGLCGFPQDILITPPNNTSSTSIGLNNSTISTGLPKSINEHPYAPKDSIDIHQPDTLCETIDSVNTSHSVTANIPEPEDHVEVHQPDTLCETIDSVNTSHSVTAYIPEPEDHVEVHQPDTLCETIDSVNASHSVTASIPEPEDHVEVHQPDTLCETIDSVNTSHSVTANIPEPEDRVEVHQPDTLCETIDSVNTSHSVTANIPKPEDHVEVHQPSAFFDIKPSSVTTQHTKEEESVYNPLQLKEEQRTSFIHSLNQINSSTNPSSKEEETQLNAIERKMKRCPYCAEEIYEEAIYCRFCQHDLDVSIPNNKHQEKEIKPIDNSTTITPFSFNIEYCLAFISCIGLFLPCFVFSGLSSFIGAFNPNINISLSQIDFVKAFFDIPKYLEYGGDSAKYLTAFIIIIYIAFAIGLIAYIYNIVNVIRKYQSERASSINHIIYSQYALAYNNSLAIIFVLLTNIIISLTLNSNSSDDYFYSQISDSFSDIFSLDFPIWSLVFLIINILTITHIKRNVTNSKEPSNSDNKESTPNTHDHYASILNMENKELCDQQLSTVINSLDASKLRKVYLSTNNLKDCFALQDCTNIIKLDIANNDIHTLGFLSKYKKIRVLDIRYNQISSLKKLNDLPTLEKIYITGNPLPQIHIEAFIREHPEINVIR